MVYVCMRKGEGHRESFVHLLLSDSFKKIKTIYSPAFAAKKRKFHKVFQSFHFLWKISSI